MSISEQIRSAAINGARDSYNLVYGLTGVTSLVVTAFLSNAERFDYLIDQSSDAEQRTFLLLVAEALR